MITKTLIVGLGGTGKAVIYGVKRHFFKDYGVDKFGVVKYVAFDTDDREFDNVTENMGPIVKEKLGLSGGDEFISAELTKEFLSNVDVNDSEANWFIPKRILRADRTDNIHGAGGIRAMGKLAFFQKQEEIERKITSNIISSADEAETEEKLGQNTVDKAALNIFLVFSVAGGTGSGSFLNFAYFLKNVFKNYGNNCMLYALVALPDVFALSTDAKYQAKMKANSYAALAELEAVMRGNVDLSFNTVTHIGKIKSDTKPIDAVFLSGITPLGSTSPKKSASVFNMMSDIIYETILDKSFSDSFLSEAVNYKKVIQDPNTNIRYCTRYHAFGMSQIGFSRRGTTLAAIYDALSKVFIGYDSGTDKLPTLSDAERKIARISIDLKFGDSIFSQPTNIAKLYPKLIANGEDNHINEWIDKFQKTVYESFKENFSRKGIGECKNYSDDLLVEFIRKSKDFIGNFNVITDINGVDNRVVIDIKNKKKAIMLELESQLSDLIFKVFTNKDREGLSYAKELLKKFKEIVSGVRSKIEVIKTNIVDIAEPEMIEFREATEDRILKIQLSECDSMFSFPLFKSSATKRVTHALENVEDDYHNYLSHEIRKFKDNVKQNYIAPHIRHKIGLICKDELLSIYEDFNNIIIEMELRLSTISEFCSKYDYSLSQHFQKYSKSLLETDDDERNIDIFNDEKILGQIIEKTYKESSLEKFEKDFIRNATFTIENGINENFNSIGEFLWWVAKNKAGAMVNLKDLKDQLENATDELIKTKDFHSDSFATIWRQTDADSNVISTSTEGLPYYTEAQSNIQGSNMPFLFIRQPKTYSLDRANYQELKKVLSIGANQTVNPSTLDSDDRLMFFTSKISLALSQFAEVEKYWETFLSLRKNDPIYYPYTDIRLIPHLTPIFPIMGERKIQMQSAYNLLLTGLLWGVLDIIETEDEGKIWVVPLEKGVQPLAGNLLISAWLLCTDEVNIKYLRERKTLRQYIETRIEEAKEVAKADPYVANAVLHALDNSFENCDGKWIIDWYNSYEEYIRNNFPIFKETEEYSDEYKDGFHKKLQTCLKTIEINEFQEKPLDVSAKNANDNSNDDEPEVKYTDKSSILVYIAPKPKRKYVM